MLYDLVRYHLGWVDERGNPVDGRRRRRCTTAGCWPLPPPRPCPAIIVPAVPAASSVELAYNFVLVHNDVQAGRIDQRAERPSIWWVWGPSQAINAGDGLHALARSELMRLCRRRRVRGHRSGSPPFPGPSLPDAVRGPVHGPDLPGPADGVGVRLPGHDSAQVGGAGRLLGAAGRAGRRTPTPTPPIACGNGAKTWAWPGKSATT